MVKLFVDDETFEVPAGINLLHAVLSAGLDLPYFCWHPELGSVGACRQCAVVAYRDEKDEHGRLTMACMTQVADGMRISLAAKNAVDFRAGVIEMLMRNHPHDCPVCEEGGECHLQDMTVMVGHTERHTRAKKRTFRNQDLGPLVNHEMNRCITCYRCVRFYRDYAGGDDLQAMGSRDRVYFGREQDGVLESAFAGNLVEVCPTGVFTDKPFSKSYTRKWDLQSAPSICNGCAVGCNIATSERYGLLKRVHNRYHADVNGYFLCDRGRFGFHWINDDAQRLRLAGERNPDGLYEEIEVESGVGALADAVRRGRVLGVGSPRASLETNHALKTLVGADRYCSGLSARELALVGRVLEAQREGVATTPSLAEIERADAVLVLGEDVLQTAPRIALALRQAVRSVTFELGKQAAIPSWADAGIRSHGRAAKSPLFAAQVLATGDDDLATGRIQGSPGELAELGFAIARAMAGRIAGADADANADTSGVGIDGEYPAIADGSARAFVAAAAAALAGAERPLIVSGTSLGEPAILDAARAVADALRGRGAPPALCLVVPECNSLGAALQGGASVESALEAIERGEVDRLIVAENDLFRRAEPARVRAALARVQVIALDSVVTPVVERADVVLPTAAFAECEGTFVSYEARAQRFYQTFQPKAPIAPAWRWLADAAGELGLADWKHVDALIASIDGEPALRGVARAAPAAGYRPDAPLGVDAKLPRQTPRSSGRTAMRAHLDVHEPRQPADDESPLAFSMEGTLDRESPILPFVWSPGWNSNQAVLRFQQEAGGELRGGSGGVRLVASPARSEGAVAARPPEAPEAALPPGALRAVPLYAVFGSDELSALSAPIAERGGRAQLALNPADGASRGLFDGQVVVAWSGEGADAERAGVRLRLVLDPSLRPGHAGYTRGVPGGIAHLPTWLRVRADDASPTAASAERAAIAGREHAIGERR